MFQQTTASKKIRNLTKRIRIIQGGTSAGKTIGIILYLINKAQREKTTISIVSESLPHLKRAAMRDFLNIMQEHYYFRADRWNKTELTYSFETGATIEFFSVDEAGKVRGPRRNILFINEANNIPFETYEQLEVRTNDEIILDFNPVSEFWVHTDVIPRIDHDFLKLTYLDNEALNPRIVESIESRKDRENWWRVYGLGEIGILEGSIYKDWELIDDIPEAARLEGYGLDFGFSSDPAAVVAVYYLDGYYILDEKLYRTGLTNNQIGNLINQWPESIVICDSAEPKSIEEIKSYDVNAVPSVKGPGSVNYGIQLIQDQKIKVTKSSINLIKEYRNYRWKLDRNGKPENVPEDIWNHALDATRYAIAYLKEGEGGESVFIDTNLAENDVRYNQSELEDDYED
jgi:phage terminase large subunit